jgi:hypothetical protein
MMTTNTWDNYFVHVHMTEPAEDNYSVHVHMTEPAEDNYSVHVHMTEPAEDNYSVHDHMTEPAAQSLAQAGRGLDDFIAFRDETVRNYRSTLVNNLQFEFAHLLLSHTTPLDLALTKSTQS